MRGWVRELDDFAERYGKGVLQVVGKASHKGALTKVHKEHDAYRERISNEESAVDKAFLEGIKDLQKQLGGD